MDLNAVLFIKCAFVVNTGDIVLIVKPLAMWGLISVALGWF